MKINDREVKAGDWYMVLGCGNDYYPYCVHSVSGAVVRIVRLGLTDLDGQWIGEKSWHWSGAEFIANTEMTIWWKILPLFLARAFPKYKYPKELK